MRNKILVITGIILLLLMLTNPSLNSFREFMGASIYDEYAFMIKRNSNFFIFSFYTDGRDIYLAIVGNFFNVESLPSRGVILPYILLTSLVSVLLVFFRSIRRLIIHIIKKLKRTSRLKAEEANSLYKFIRRALKRKTARYAYRGHDQQRELFALLNDRGIRIQQNQFGRQALIREIVSSQEIYNLISPFIGFSCTVAETKHFFGGDGIEITETEYGLRELIIVFDLNTDDEQQLIELIVIQERQTSGTEPPNDKNSIDELFRKALEFKGSGEYTRFFSFISKFNHYSRYNSMLVFIQNPGITFFGTAYYWRVKFQRTIKDDARPHIILQPGGPVTLAYDIFDTLGKLSPKDFLDQGLGREIFEIKGNFKMDYLDKLLAFAKKFNIKVEEKPMSYFTGGAVTTYLTGKLEIYLRQDNSKSQQFATLCHELAHIFLGHTRHKELQINNKANSKVRLPQREALSQRQEELEAETVNFLVCKRLGLETQSMEYLAGYITRPSDWKLFSYELVIKVADRLEGELI